MKPLTPAQIERIRSSVASVDGIGVRHLRRYLQDIAGAFLRQRAQPAPSKSDVRYELQMIAHWAWKMEAGNLNRSEAGSRLRLLVGGLSDIAHTTLWGGLDRHPAYDKRGFVEFLQDPNVDWKVVGEAAEIGLGLLPNGDYSDATASLAIQRLVLLYDIATKRKATFSTVSTDRLGVKGNHRQLGNSACFRLVAAFFREVDKQVTPLWLTGKFRAFLRGRKRLALQKSKRSIDLLNGDTLSQV